MERFAFVIHPIDMREDVARKFPVARHFPEEVVAGVLRHVPPMAVAHITGVRSIAGAEAEGWFIACPLSPYQLLNLPPETVYRKLEACCHIAQRLGAKIIGLGALTSVAGDGGITLAKRVDIAVTTGNSYTVATAVEGAVKAAALMDLPIGEAQVAVVGASGSIGRTCALLLAPRVHGITLVGRHVERLEPIAREVAARNARVRATSDVGEGLRDADIVITVTSSADAVVEPEHLKRGAIVCDVARPRDVSVRVARERKDVLVIEGGVVKIPGAMKMPKTDSKGREKHAGEFSFGFPPGTAYACMSETMLLALEGRYESYTLGKTVSVEQVEGTLQMAQKHGFQLAGFRSFERAVTEQTIAEVRRAAGRKLV